MAGKRWMTATFAAAVLAVAAPRAFPQSPANQPQLLPVIQPDMDSYFESLAKTISDAPNQQQRYEAAQRLVECPQLHALHLITTLLSGSDERAQYTCARAIAESTAPASLWINSLAPLLNRSTPTSDVAAKALSRYDTLPTAYRDALIVGITSAPTANRVGIIAALGRVIQKQVARALVGIVADPAQPTDVRNAAGEALSRLSGRAALGDAAAFWNAWLASRDSLPDSEWRKTVVEEQHATLQTDELLLRDRLAQFRARVNSLELHRYTVELAERKDALLLDLLLDADPDIRAAGTFVAADAVNSPQSLKGRVRSRLFELVGDPSAEVRRGVAGVLFDLADTEAFNPILLQLQVETNLQIKLALIKALARTDARALPVLEQMVRQGPPAIAAGAADAIATRSAPFFQKADQLAGGIEFLKKALEDRTGPIGAPNADADLIALRAHLVDAIAALAERSPRLETSNDLAQLTGQNEPVVVRRSALLGLGSLGPAAGEMGEVVKRALNPTDEPDPAIRQAAATALGTMGMFTYYDDLDRLTIPQNEINPDVRAAAKLACSRLLPAGLPGQTQQKADDLEHRDENDRALDAYIITIRKLADSKNEERTLALDRKTVGDLYLNKLKDPRNAITYYRDSLKYFQEKEPRTSQGVIEGIISAMLRAHFTLDDFDTGLKFGADQIQRDPRTQDTVGAEITGWADNLTQPPASAESYARARELITLTLARKDSGALNISESQKERLGILLRMLPPAPSTQPAR